MGGGAVCILKLRPSFDFCFSFPTYFIQYKSSAWVPVFAGIHAPGRARQHIVLLDSIFDKE